MSTHEASREDANREDAKRQHRAIALFCVIQCWVQKLDGVTLNRSDLERLLGLERFKESRVNWLSEDFEDFFPFHKPEKDPYETSSGYINDNQETFSRLIVSRVSLEQNPRIDSFKLWRLPTKQELDKLFDFVPFLADYDNRDYRILTLYLSLLAQGQISPKSIPPLNEQYEAAEQIVAELLPKLAVKLIHENQTVGREIANFNNSSGWGYDSYNNLSAWFTLDGQIEFLVELVLDNKQHPNQVLYSNNLRITLKGELSIENKNWQIGAVQIL